jgi:hypothetical protein
MKTLFISFLVAGGLFSSSTTPMPTANESLDHDCEVTVGSNTVKCNDCNCEKILRDLLKAQ